MDFYFVGELPVIIGADKILAREILAAHEIVGLALLAVVALHAAAALFHHFIGATAFSKRCCRAAAAEVSPPDAVPGEGDR